MGLALSCPAQPTTASPPPATPIAVRGRPALATEIPTPAKADAMGVTLHRHEESRGTAVHHQQERHRPAWSVQDPLGMAPAIAKKTVNKSAPEKPLAVELGPVTTTGRSAGAGGLVGVTLEPTPQEWCPLHGISLHDVTTCRYIRHLVEIRRERLTKRAAEGVTHGCYECGQCGDPA
jgi:hypothetical protein